MLGTDRLYQVRQAEGTGSNSIKQKLSGNGCTVENSIDSVGELSVAASAAASPDGVDLSQQVAGAGELSASIQGTQGDDSAGQEASVLGGVLSSSQSLSASAGDGVSAAQATKMAGVIGRVSSGAISEEKAMITSGSFLGAGTLSAEMNAQSDGSVQSQASVAVDGTEWLKQSDIDEVSQDGVGMAVEGLRLDDLGNVGSFTMQAASMDRADYEKDVADRAVSSDKGSEEDGVGSTVMYLNNPNAYLLAGWKWTQNNPQIKMYLKKDANFNNEGLDAEATKRAIEAAANTWDNAVPQNLFADSNLVTVTEASNINTDTKDGYNTHGWKPITEGLAYSRTYYSTSKVGGYYPALESDIVYDSDYQWATNGGNYDVQSVALHEMGHTIGLGDLYGKPEYAGDTDQVMHYYTGVKHELGVGDRTGACLLYGRYDGAIPVFRMYSPYVTDHFYTTNYDEYSSGAVKVGYSQEGILGYLYPTNVPGTIPIYRMYSPYVKDHFYTTNYDEYSSGAVKVGYSQEGLLGYLYITNEPGTTPAYRMYSPQVTDHFYTTNYDEYTTGAVKVGYSQEGTLGYLLS